MEKPKNSKHADGDFLFKNAPESVKKLHQAFKKTHRTNDRQEFMQRQRAANAADFSQ